MLVKTNSLKWKEIEKDVFEKACIKSRKGLNISILKINPEKEIPMHDHPQTRYNFILRGSMSDGKHKYGKGDILVNKKGTKHALKSGSEGCEFLLMWNFGLEH